MKRCPQCAADYYDEMLEFCLEDGAKLFTVSKTLTKPPSLTKPHIEIPFTEKTLNLPFNTETQTVESIKPKDVQTVRRSDFAIAKVSSAGSKILEIAPVFFALAHNWWQWLYATNQSYSPISSFLISGSFLTWLLLLTIGAGISLLAIKRSQNKGFAYTGLVILAVNLILFLVPKR